MKEIDLSNVFGGASGGRFANFASSLGGPKVTLPSPATNTPSIVDQARGWLRQGILNGDTIQP